MLVKYLDLVVDNTQESVEEKEERYKRRYGGTG